MYTLQNYYFDLLVFKKIYSEKLKSEANSAFLVLNIIRFTHYTLYPEFASLKENKSDCL